MRGLFDLYLKVLKICELLRTREKYTRYYEERDDCFSFIFEQFKKELTEMARVIAVGKCVKGKIVFTKIISEELKQHA